MAKLARIPKGRRKGPESIFLFFLKEKALVQQQGACAKLALSLLCKKQQPRDAFTKY